MKFRITSGAKVNCEKKTCKMELGVGRSAYMSMCFWSTGEMYHDLLAAGHFPERSLSILPSVAWSKSCLRANLILGRGCGRGPDVTSTNDLEAKSLNLSPGPLPTWRFSHSSEDIAVWPCHLRTQEWTKSHWSSSDFPNFPSPWRPRAARKSIKNDSLLCLLNATWIEGTIKASVDAWRSRNQIIK